MKWMKNKPNIKNIKKIASKYGVEVAPNCELTKEPDVGSQPTSLPHNNMKNFDQIQLDNDKFINLSGLQVTTESYSGLLNPICKYSFSKLLDSMNKPLFFTANGFSKYPGTCEITTDVDKTETVVNDACVVYSDKIITISEEYGIITVSCYAKDKKDTKKFLKSLNDKMVKENQYKGKCLFFSGDNIVFRDTPAVDWDDVVMADNKKKEIKINTLDFLTNKKFANLGINRRGLILYGPPGTGKTMMIKSLFNKMKNAGITRIYTTADTFTYTETVGELFDFLKFSGKTMLAFEDMDLISPERNDGNGRKVLGALLNNLDGIRKIQEPLVVVGTTNDIGMIDKALANRPCRFDRKIEVPIPQGDQIKQFFKMLTDSNISEEIASMAEGFSGAHIKEAINTAKLLSAETGLNANDCLKDACSIIKNNFFPMTAEASKKIYKNKEGKLNKEAQYSIINPILMNPNGLGDYLFPFMTIKQKPSEFSNKEATALWKLWKEHEGKISDNKIHVDRDKYASSVRILTEGDILKSTKSGNYSLTDKGQKLLRSIILTTEVNSFEKNASEPEEIDMNEVEKKIHANKKTKITTSDKKEKIVNCKSKKEIGNDWYFNVVKNIKKEN